MAMNLFGPASVRWVKENYGAPFNSMNEAPTSKNTSKYNVGSGKTSTARKLSGIVLEALMRLRYEAQHEGFGRITETEVGRVFVETPLIPASNFRPLYDGETEVNHEELPLVQILYCPHDGEFRGRIKDGEFSSPLQYRSNELYYFMAVIAAAVRSDPQKEAKEQWAAFLSDPNVDSAVVLSNNVFVRNTYADTCEEKWPGSRLKANLDRVYTLTDSDVENVSKYEKSSAPSPGVSEKPPASVSEMKGMYAFSDRELTAEEQMLVPVIPESYQIGEIHHKVARLIKQSTSLPNPLRNFIFVGEAGSGKTEAVKIMAYLANKPLLHQSMDPDTDKFDVCQQVIPDGNGGFMYVEGPLIEALEKGWFVEVSEADLILKQGALGYLNPLLDKTGVLRLNTGRLVVRHPEAVVFFTINGNYEGCRPMNKAVKDRCMTVGFEKPEDETLIARIMSESGLEDKETVKKMVDVMHRVEDHCAVNCLDDGVVGVRSLIRWATAVACGEDPWEVAKESLLYGWTLEKSEHPALLKCVETQFTPKEVVL